MRKSLRRTLLIGGGAAVCAFVAAPLWSIPPENQASTAQPVSSAVQPVLRELESAYPEIYSGAEIQAEERVAVIYGTTESPPESVQRLIDTVSKDSISLRWQVAGFSAAEAIAAIEAFPPLDGVWEIAPSADSSMIIASVSRGTDVQHYPQEMHGIPIEYLHEDGNIVPAESLEPSL
ncbi:MAG: hypothetical protein ACK5LO_06925 [Leucobacter sp.]